MGSSLRRILHLTVCCLAVLGLAACGAAGHAQSRLQVVAAENFWGSIASQLGGDRVDRPQHHRQPRYRSAQLRADRRPTPGRWQARQVAIVNGIGYDNWASQLLAAELRPTASSSRSATSSASEPVTTPTSGTRRPSVRRVIAAIVAAYGQVDPADGALLRRAGAPLRDDRARPATTRCARRSAAGTPACRSATARASSRRSARASG